MVDVTDLNSARARKLIGLLPAAGVAGRLGPLPCSKEIYPVGFGPTDTHGNRHARVAATGILESMHLAGAQQAFFILRSGKWDIPAYYGHGGRLNMPVAYLLMNHPYGAPYTLDQAYPFVENATILFGFPDILFHPQDAFTHLLKRQSETNADIVLGAFKADNPAKMDMLVLDNHARVKDILIKPAKTQLTYTWIIAVWTDRFTRYLHHFVAEDFAHRSKLKRDIPELFVGDVIRAASQDQWPVEIVFFDQGAYLDVGTPEDMQKAMSDSNWTYGGYK